MWDKHQNSYGNNDPNLRFLPFLIDLKDIVNDLGVSEALSL
jgi:hypothetical protein